MRSMEISSYVNVGVTDSPIKNAVITLFFARAYP